MKLEEKIKWSDFDKIHVIKQLRQIIAQWWNIQINFTDEKGYIRGVPNGKFFSPRLAICQNITASSSGFKGCMSTVRQAVASVMSQKNERISVCHAGFSSLSVPIVKDGQFLGCIFADGFVLKESEKEQKLKIKNYLTKLFPNDKTFETKIEDIAVLSEKEATYLSHMLRIIVQQILQVQKDLMETKEEVKDLREQLHERFSFEHMIGKSEAMQELYQMLERVSDSQSLILIQGENGTGKELVARALHYHSKRKDKPFIVINCGAFNDNLLESELFGHTKGAFTGAIKDKEGLFAAAGLGTIFLDEIGDTSPAMQVKLLRVLQDQTFTKVGSTKQERSQARVVCATNKNLEQMVQEGSFREDLFFRLNVITLYLPPLRERKEDIPLLIAFFLKKYATATKTKLKKIAPNFLYRLLDYKWPGNIRELSNEIERLCVLSGEEEDLNETFLSKRIALSSMESKISENDFDRSSASTYGTLKEAVEALEKKLIAAGLKRTKGNKSKLAKELDISRANLIMKVQKYKID